MTDTTTTITSSVNPTTYGAVTTLSAHVVSNDMPGMPGPPTGTVTFFNGASPLATRSLDGSGDCSLTNVDLGDADTYSVTAVYNGDGDFNPSTSSPLSQVVNKAVGTSFLHEEFSSIYVRTPTTPTLERGAGISTGFQADIGAPEGTLTLRLGTDVIGSSSLSGGHALITGTVPNVSMGQNTLFWDYSGDSNHEPSTGSLNVDVEFETYVTFGYTFTSESSGLTQNYTAKYGVPVTITAQLRGSRYTGSINHSGPIFIGGVTGNLVFKEGSTVLGTAALNTTTEKASVVVNLPIGVHTIDAFFAADDAQNVWAGDSLSFLGGSTSALSGTVTVTKNDTVTVLISDPFPPPNGNVAFLATVTGNPQVSGVPTGMVRLLQVSPSPAALNLVQNPGFETGDLTSWTDSGDTGASGVYSGDSHSGDFSYRAGPSSLGYLSQIITTVPGTEYEFSFWILLNGASDNEFIATWDGVEKLHLNNVSVPVWTRYAYNVTATGLSTEVKFGFRNPPAYDYLDEVGVVEVVAPPAPFTPFDETRPLVSGVATFSVQWNDFGTDWWTATYLGDSNYNGSEDDWRRCPKSFSLTVAGP